MHGLRVPLQQSLQLGHVAMLGSAAHASVKVQLIERLHATPDVMLSVCILLAQACCFSPDLGPFANMNTHLNIV